MENRRTGFKPLDDISKPGAVGPHEGAVLISPDHKGFVGEGHRDNTGEQPERSRPSVHAQRVSHEGGSSAPYPPSILDFAYAHGMNLPGQGRAGLLDGHRQLFSVPGGLEPPTPTGNPMRGAVREVRPRGQGKAVTGRAHHRRSGAPVGQAALRGHVLPLVSSSVPALACEESPPHKPAP
ncbi:hypothetical protein GCM10009548_04230 [Streptomyces malaysiensis subsp. malaysiensis]